MTFVRGLIQYDLTTLFKRTVTLLGRTLRRST